MRDSELTVKIQSSIGRQCYARGYAAPVDVLMDVNVQPLRFSKNGNPKIEQAYATHYVDGKRIAELKIKFEREKDNIDGGKLWKR